jgi:L-ribulokinase
MQTYADVIRRPLALLASEQGPALGAAIQAAVAAGAYPDVYAASGAMGRREEAVFVPDAQRAEAYDALYAEYCRLHDAFGPDDGPLGGLLHRLRARRRETTARTGHDSDDASTTETTTTETTTTKTTTTDARPASGRAVKGGETLV